MKKLELYECEICGTRYKDRLECERCEEHHRHNLRIIAARYNAHDQGSDDGFPVKITVTDGIKQAVYRR